MWAIDTRFSLFVAVYALFAAIAWLSVTPPASAAVKEVTFGVVPQQSAGELATRWVPVLRYLGDKADLHLSFKTARDIPTFERRLAAGEYDIAYMNPYHYTVFHERPGYRVFAKEAEKQLIGILVVRQDSPLRDIGQLNGVELAFPAPAAFAATVLPRARLAKLGIAVQPRFVGSHKSVYLGVAEGLFAAGTGIMRTFEMLPPAQRSKLRILWKTPAYTPHAFAYRPQVSPALVARLERAMFEMHTSEKGRLLLDGVGLRGIVSATDKEYDPIRQLDIKLLDRIGN